MGILSEYSSPAECPFPEPELHDDVVDDDREPELTKLWFVYIRILPELKTITTRSRPDVLNFHSE